jgi:hypothetical protein
LYSCCSLKSMRACRKGGNFEIGGAKYRLATEKIVLALIAIRVRRERRFDQEDNGA